MPGLSRISSNISRRRHRGKCCEQLIARMNIAVRDLLREKGTPYRSLGLRRDVSDAALLDAMMAHPILINRPIVVTPIGVRLCRPSEAVLDLLPIQQREFVKEDGERVIDTRPRARHDATVARTARLRRMARHGIPAGGGRRLRHHGPEAGGRNIALALLCNTIPTGAILVVLILIFGPLSGAHFNPAVTWRSPAARTAMGIAAAYVAVQIAGALPGVWTSHLMFELTSVAIVAHLTGGSRTMAGGSSRDLRAIADDLRLFGARLPRSPMRSASTSRRPIGSPHRHHSRIRR